MLTNHDAAGSALYHIEAIERRLKLLKQYINPRIGVINDTPMVARLMNGIEDEFSDLRNDIVKFL